MCLIHAQPTNMWSYVKEITDAIGQTKLASLINAIKIVILSLVVLTPAAIGMVLNATQTFV